MAKDTVAEIKNRLSIQDVVAPYVKLKRAGRSITGLCPFHKEKTPSFHVSIDRGTFHCFGCGVGGDMFTFVEKIEGLDFKGALALLADKAGVEIVYDPKAKESASHAERLRDAMLKAVEFYQGRLTKDSEAYTYALSRGLTQKTIADWQLGVAPDDWRKLLEHLTSLGYTLDELKAAGLIKEADGKAGTYYDRFRNRLMFPIRDMGGRTVAFTGRALNKNEPLGRDSAASQAKYLNSPETDLYHKSQVLFGLDKAKEAIRTRGFALLVEGQMDLLHAHQAGFENAIALSGTAFTADHARLLKRYSENLMLALDADSAGLSATQKSALVALAAGMRVKAVRLPTGKDPADVMSEDAKDFTARVKAAESVVEFFLAILAERERDPHRLVLASEKIVLPLIRAIESPMEREHFIQSAAQALGLSAEAVRASMAKLPIIKSGDESMLVQAPSRPKFGAREQRREALRAVLTAYPETELAKRVLQEYTRITEATLDAGAIDESAVFKAEQIFGENPPPEAADELLHAFETAYVREAYQERVTDLRRAERAGDEAVVKKIQGEVAELSKRLALLTH